MKEFIHKIITNKIIRFIMVGGGATLIDFVIYMILSEKLDITISKSISMICSSVFSYIANKTFTFSNRDKTNVIHFIKFYGVFLANFVTNLGVNRFIFFITDCKVIAFILATICGMTVNYLGQRFIVFRK